MNSSLASVIPLFGGIVLVLLFGADEMPAMR
jgi:hypothetical protein